METKKSESKQERQEAQKSPLNKQEFGVLQQSQHEHGEVR
jgi:hypothetical protein